MNNQKTIMPLFVEVASIVSGYTLEYYYLVTQIDVPFEHVSDGLTLSSLPPPMGDEVHLKQLIRFKSGPDKPDNAFTAVKYEDHWFWIDKGDLQSKRTFSFLLILFSLTETGGKEGLPVVTIPAG